MKLKLFALMLIAAFPFMVQAESIVAINMDEVFAKSNLVKHRSQQMRDTVKGVQNKIKAEDEKIEILETEVSIRTPKSPRYDEFREQLEVAKLRRDLYRDRQGKRIGKMEMDLLLQSYQDMQQLVSEFGKEKQVDFILLLTEGDFQASSVQSLRLQISQRGIIYANPEKNLTAEFIEFANGRFRGVDHADSDAPATTPAAGTP